MVNNKIILFFAILIGKAVRLLCRLLKRGGTATPGLIANKIYPYTLKELSNNTHTIVITGTNGKTTCSRMIEQAVLDAGYSVLANRSGANLLSGITSEFIANSTLLGKCKKEFAIIECDEAACRRVLPLLSPIEIVVTNIFRDQLDRYGEVSKTLNLIREAIISVPNSKIVLNSDCSLTSSLSFELSNSISYYGLSSSSINSSILSDLSDATHCIRCKNKYNYSYNTYAHLGGFYCNCCGYKRIQPKYEVISISDQADLSNIVIRIDGKEFCTTVNLPGIYNVYNAIACIATVLEAGISLDIALLSLQKFRCGFGRMEKFDFGVEGSRMLLIKNPAGCNQALSYINFLHIPCSICICLNDNEQDGTDISWIWDADYEILLNCEVNRIIVCGTRRFDLALRLKYAGIDEEKILVANCYNDALNILRACNEKIIFLPNYTSMLELRSILIKQVGGTEFWEG